MTLARCKAHRLGHAEIGSSPPRVRLLPSVCSTVMPAFLVHGVRIHLAQVACAPDARAYVYCLTVQRADMTRSRHQFCVSGWSVKLVFAAGAA